VLETVAEDAHLKQMPTGQLELLMSDDTVGLVHKHIHIRRPVQHFAELPLSLYPPLAVPEELSDGLHLRLPTLDFEEKKEEQISRRRPNRGARL